MIGLISFKQHCKPNLSIKIKGLTKKQQSNLTGTLEEESENSRAIDLVDHMIGGTLQLGGWFELQSNNKLFPDLMVADIT